MRVAALDCGTNTLRLLIADVDRASGTQVDLVRRSEIVRLGQGVDKTGELALSALERTFAVLDAYRAVIEQHGVDPRFRRLVATSAVRDVSNRDAFFRGVEEILGVTPWVVTGEEEAWLTYDGASRAFGERSEIVEPVLVLDIGGGSTEIVVADEHTGRVHGTSLDIGSVRLTERHLRATPPSAEQVQAVTRDVDAALDTVDTRLREARSVVGVAGSVMTVGAMVLGLQTYDKPRLHLTKLPRAEVDAAVERLLQMTIAERRALPFMAPGRADVIGAGGIILRQVLRRAAVDAVFPSIQDILDGVAWRIAAGDG